MKKLFNNMRMVSAIIIFLSLTANSCKKELTSSPQTNLENKSSLNNSSIANAKEFFDKVQPSAVFSTIAANTNKTASIDETKKHFTDFIKPDWDNAISYEKNGKEITEVPLNASTPLGFKLGLDGSSGFDFSKNLGYTKYLIIKDENGYRPYLFTVIADSSYIGNDRSKLLANSYQKRDPGFSGVFMYHTIYGQLLNFYRYQNGKITQTGHLADVSQPIVQNLSISGSSKKVNGCYYISMPVYVGTITVGNVSTSQYEIQTVLVCFPDSDIGGGGGGSGQNPGDNTSFPSPEQTQEQLNAAILQALFDNSPEFQEYYNSIMNDKERELTLKYPIEAAQVFANAIIAKVDAALNFPGLSLHDDIGDAFRHAYWNALNARYISAEIAKLFSDAHEYGNVFNISNNFLDITMKMDLANNATGIGIGISLYSSNPQVTAGMIMSTVYNAAINGLLVMVENNQLVPTHN